MGILRTILKIPCWFCSILKLRRLAGHAHQHSSPHLEFCFTLLHKFSRSFTLVIQQLDTNLRNTVCVFYVVLRALDTVEDDTSIPTDVKVPILINFHKYIYDPTWHFPCGTKDYKFLMDNIHHVSNAFLELDISHQEVIEDITKRMGAGMAKFIINEVQTVDEYDEYCHYVAGLVGLGLSKLCHFHSGEDMPPDSLPNSFGLLLQKTNIIQDYLEDINEIPKPRMFWPREIWSKYASKLEDFKYEENSVKAMECLNEMVTNALTHVEDCLKCTSGVRDPSIFRSCAIPQIMAMGTLTLCYNNIQVFRGVVKMKRGDTIKVFYRTKTMADVYGAFFDFACMMKHKVDKNDPNATNTLTRLDAIQKVCTESGVLHKRKLYILKKESTHNSTLVLMVIIMILTIVSASLMFDRLNS